MNAFFNSLKRSVVFGTEGLIIGIIWLTFIILAFRYLGFGLFAIIFGFILLSIGIYQFTLIKKGYGLYYFRMTFNPFKMLAPPEGARSYNRYWLAWSTYGNLLLGVVCIGTGLFSLYHHI